MVDFRLFSQLTLQLFGSSQIDPKTLYITYVSSRINLRLSIGQPRPPRNCTKFPRIECVTLGEHFLWYVEYLWTLLPLVS
ncbi:unnamed protein product [Brassica oleracea]